MPYGRVQRRPRWNVRQVIKNIGTAARVGYNAYSLGRSAYQSWKKVSGGSNSARRARTNWTTQQHDARTVYRKQRMPRAKKQLWRKFSRKVNAVVDAGLGSRTVVINSSGTALGSPSGQAVTLLHLYAIGTQVSNNFESGVNDLQAIKASIGAVVGNNEKVRFENGVLDVTFTNSGETAIEVDVYEYQVGKRTSAAPSLLAAIGQATADAGTLPGTTPLTIADRGVTPFDMPLLAANEGVKIISKRKYYTTPGNAFNYQLRDPKNHYMNTDDMGQVEWSKPYLTKGVFVIFKNIPGAIAGDAEITWGCTRSYKYVLLENNAQGSGRPI